MMKRVYKGRIIPLIVIFFAIILPQFMMNLVGYGGGSIVQDILSMVLLGLGVLYLCLFGIFTVQFHQYERNLHPEDEHVKWKYAGIYCVIIVVAFMFAGVIVFKFSSDYNISDRKMVLLLKRID